MYTISEVIYKTGRTVLYRGVRDADGLPVVLKVLGPQHRPQHVAQLKHEYEIGRMLDVPTAVRPLALDTYEGMPALVMPDSGGRPLDRLLGAPMGPGRFLPLAIRIADAVVEIHEKNIIHRDLKPENILIHPATGEVQIADFGIASPLSGALPAAGSARLLEGSLPYMSPEQTGRMNRMIDQRSDLYTLGVTFYQMLTGRLPFEAADPLEWVHCHIARSPAAPQAIVPSVPAPLSAIVMKLLAKEAEDRYQSARGLRHDLARCLDLWRSSGSIAPFPLGERDVSDRFRIPHRLYGRDEEIAALLGAFQRVVDTGVPELVLIAGYAGIGKSSLVHELHKPIVRARGTFVSGKFDQYKRDIPYFTIVQAFTEIVLEILAESEVRIASWRQRLQAALGVNGQLIIDVIPQVELVIGRQAPVPALPPGEAQNRFRNVFRDFIGVFAQREHPLAVFLDDLQWADWASLALLQDLLTAPEGRRLLLVGAYRDNEVTASHPLMLAVHEARKLGAPVSTIALGPLSREHLGALLADALRCNGEDVAPLSDLLLQKTAGNPFFAIQFLTALHDERLLEFDGGTGTWRWDLRRIRAKGFTDNVVELMVGKVRRLSGGCQEALTQLACLGDRADAATLALVLGRPEDDTHEALAEAVRAGLLWRLGDTYKFPHDRIQEAAYSLLPEESRPAAHLRIGRVLLASLPDEALEERAFDVANQLNRGVAFLTDPQERASLCRLNSLAGRKAKAAIAYESANRYLAQATALLPADAWSAGYQDAFALYLDRSECAYLAGDFQEADELFNLLLSNAGSNLDRARVYGLRMRLYQVSGRYDEGVTVALKALQLFGVTLPESDAEIEAATEAEAREISASLRGRRIADLVDAKVATDPDARAIIGLLVDAEPCAYIGRMKLFPLLALKAVNFSLRCGNTEESCFAYSVYGFLLVSMFGDIPSGFAFSEMSLRLNERFNDPRLKGTLLHLHGDHINFWRRHIATDLPILERAFRACVEVGDLVYAGFLAFETVWQVVEKGDPLDEVLKVSERYAAFARQSHNEAVYETIRLEQRFAAALKGATHGPASFDGDGFNEPAFLDGMTRATFGCGVVFFHILKQIAAFMYGRYAEALRSAAQAGAVIGAAMAMPIEATHHFFHALTLTALYPEAPAPQRQEFARALGGLLGKLRRWADHCPENYLNRHALVSAEVARIEGRDLDAMRLYDQAIRSAGENGFVQNEALANELAARFYRARGFERIANAYLCEARSCYARWGADGKVGQIDRLYPHLIERRPLAPTVTFAVGAEQLDALSVIKASQAISGEIVLDKLLGTLVRVVLEQAGAQKGYVILHREGRLSIEAEALLEEGGAVAVRLLRSLPVAASPLLPTSIVGYVWRTRQQVLLEDAAESPKFAADDYIVRSRPRSILCLPILRQGEPVGLLYLENNSITGAFMTDSLQIIELLASQAAISLQNALLHRETENAVRLRDEFLSIASHELRTPITSLQLVVQGLTQGVVSPSPEHILRAFTVAQRQIKRLTRLVEELLEVTRIQAGVCALHLEPVDLAAVVREVAQRLEHDFAAARSPLSLAADGPVMGRWDRSKLEQVVTNLLSNAIKFGAGKPVEVIVEEAPRGTGRLVVLDHGIGIPPARLPYIFDRFERAVSAREYGGLGLGLFIVRSIVGGLGGAVRAESVPAGGSAFTVELPCAGPPLPERPGGAA